MLRRFFIGQLEKIQCSFPLIGCRQAEWFEFSRMIKRHSGKIAHLAE
jgi:hypothetical protein